MPSQAASVATPDDFSGVAVATPLERRRENQRLRIIAVADRLYRQNGGLDGGYENTKVETIAEQSDISLRTFFRYFDSKADVIYLDTRGSTAHLRQFLSRRLERESVRDALLNSRHDQFQWITSTEVGRERFLRALSAPQFRSRLVAMREETKQAVKDLVEPFMRGSPEARRIKASTLAVIYNGLFTEAHDRWAEDQSTDIRQYVTDCLALIPQLLEE